VLKTKRGAPEIITTIMLNYIALRVVEFSVQGPLQERARSQPQTMCFLRVRNWRRSFPTRICTPDYCWLWRARLYAGGYSFALNSAF
jgi:ABC-type uncharacterized transport system permease subunit